MKKIIHICLYMAILVVAMSFSPYFKKKYVTSELTISLNHFVGNEILKLDSDIYKNELGQTFNISNFKYYLSNFHFKNNAGTDFYVNESFFVNEDEASTKQLHFKNLPGGNYTSLDFIIGVDSLHNCSGAQSGALDPVNAMYWAWNTGYIFLKLEGTSQASKSPGNFFEYHIGGYKQPYNSIRKITLDLNTQPVKIEAAKNFTIELKVNLLEILKAPTTIDFEKLPAVTDAKNATVIANNYSDMFEVLKK